MKYFLWILLLLVSGNISQASVPAEFEESPLSACAGIQGEAYRVAIVPFGESPLLVRVVFDGQNYLLTAKQLSGEGLYFNGTLVAIWQAQMSRPQWEKFRERVESSSFWQKESKVREPAILDGTFYWMEGYRNGKTLCLERHCVGALPEDKGLEKMAYYFLQFSREKAILRRSPYYSSPVSTSEGKAILIGTRNDYRSKR